MAKNESRVQPKELNEQRRAEKRQQKQLKRAAKATLKQAHSQLQEQR